MDQEKQLFNNLKLSIDKKLRSDISNETKTVLENLKEKVISSVENKIENLQIEKIKRLLNFIEKNRNGGFIKYKTILDNIHILLDVDEELIKHYQNEVIKNNIKNS